MITEETYKEMRRLVDEYETPEWAKPVHVEQPYLITHTVGIEKKYNPKYDIEEGITKVCKCGHNYERHFDTYEHMEAVGCKYCHCDNFEEKTEN